MKTRTIFVLGIIFLIVIIALQNTTITTIYFLFWSFSASRILVILGSFIIGVLTGILVSIKCGNKTVKPNK